VEDALRGVALDGIEKGSGLIIGIEQAEEGGNGHRIVPITRQG